MTAQRMIEADFTYIVIVDTTVIDIVLYYTQA
jgi:hypothetical protein